MAADFEALGGIVVRKSLVDQLDDALRNAAKQHRAGDEKKRTRLMSHLVRVVEAIALRSKEGRQKCCGHLEEMLDVLVSTGTDTDLAVKFKTLDSCVQSAQEQKLRT